MLENIFRRWLIISAHPDDETLGAGGTLHRLRALGKEIHWLNVCDMDPSYGYTTEACRKKTETIDRVKRHYGFDSFASLGQKPAGLGSVQTEELIEMLGKTVTTVEPEALIINSGIDAHSDHRILRDALQSVMKSFRYPSIRLVMEMEILSETNQSFSLGSFAPNFWVDISNYMPQKLETLKLYETELGAHPFPRSLEAVKAQALLRGSENGLTFAEAFRIVKLIA